MTHEPLNLPKPDAKPDVISRETRKDARQEARLLQAVGERIAPEGSKYCGSVAAHVSFSQLRGEYFLTMQTVGLTGVPETIALESIKELSRATMRAYGKTPPRKTNDVETTET